MKKLVLFPLSIAAFLAACDTESTSSVDPLAGSPKGDLRYERHFEKNQISFKCNVYATNSDVTVDMTVNVLDEQQPALRYRVNGNYNTAVYSGAIESSGLYNKGAGFLCEKAKEDCESMNNVSVNCSDNKVVFSANIPNVDPTYSEIYVSRVLPSMNSVCDEMFELYLNDPLIIRSGDATKKAQTCDVQVAGSTVTMVITYPDKSMHSTATLVNGVYSVREEYTGVDAATLAQVCTAYQNEDGLTNVTCSGNVFTYTPLIVPEFSAFVEFERDVECPAFLDGSMTFEDLWFDED